MGKVADPLEKPVERFTYADYLAWPDDERWELIDGEARAMSSPSEWHQTILTRFFGELYTFLKGRPCRLLVAPFDVLLPRSEEEDGKVDTVVQPDIVVFCDRTKLREPNARGAPDLVVEISSPSTVAYDRTIKFRLYERAGVREYWIVDASGLGIEVHSLVPVPGGRKRLGAKRVRSEAGDRSRVESTVLEGFSIDPEELFAPA